VTPDFILILIKASMERVNYKKVTTVLILLLMFSLRASAPFCESLFITVTPPLNPYLPLMQAIGMVETMYDTLAYNAEEEAAGYFQIRPVRIKDYNRLTGSSYTTRDMFDYKVSEKIFLYFADRIGPYDFEKIARKWNGSGSMTTYYWNRIRELLPE